MRVHAGGRATHQATFTPAYNSCNTDSWSNALAGIEVIALLLRSLQNNRRKSNMATRPADAGRCEYYGAPEKDDHTPRGNVYWYKCVGW